MEVGFLEAFQKGISQLFEGNPTKHSGTHPLPRIGKTHLDGWARQGEEPLHDSLTCTSIAQVLGTGPHEGRDDKARGNIASGKLETSWGCADPLRIHYDSTVRRAFQSIKLEFTISTYPCPEPPSHATRDQ